MRFKFRGGFVLLIAVFALSAVGVSSAAAALPEFTGHFPTEMTLKDTQDLRFEEVDNGESLECRGLEARGSITGAKTAVATITLTNCGYAGYPTSVCTSVGLKAGEIRTEEVPVVPVYISKATKEVGLDFNEYTKGKPTFAKFTCEGRVNGTVVGAVIAPITPVNVKTTSFSLKLKETGGRQLPSAFESEGGAKIENYLEGTYGGGLGYFQEGLRSGETVSLHTGNAFELKA
jgi:hypothetical protein